MFDNPRQEPEQLRALRAQIRRFVQQKAPREKRREWDRSHTWPRELFADDAEYIVAPTDRQETSLLRQPVALHRQQQ